MAESAQNATQPAPRRSVWRVLRGLLTAQAFGQFNDQAWKQIVILLAMATVASEAAKQQKAAFAQIVLLVPLVFFSLPAGVLADRVSKRSVIIAMKVLELVLMLAGTAALFFQPHGGVLAMAVLGCSESRPRSSCRRSTGSCPKILPHEQLSAGNGVLEMTSNLALLAGIVAGPAHPSGGRRYTRGSAGMISSVLSGCGLLAALDDSAGHGCAGGRGAGATGADGLGVDQGRSRAAAGPDRPDFVWTIATLVPPPILAYDASNSGLTDWQSGLPLAALGIGVGVGCLLAGKLSASKVEYGLLPLGALGLTVSTLAFAAIGPGLAGTIVVMTFLGIFSGLLFVPLNALLQWRSPADRRGAVIADGEVLVYGGMFLGSLLALVLARAGISARGTFLGASIVLAAASSGRCRWCPMPFCGSSWSAWRTRSIACGSSAGRTCPSEGGALLVPNHVTFADGLFMIASTDRPVRFVVYADYFDRPFIGWMLRSMKAIPISPSGGPKMILQAFREAGQALDAGELVCLFPEGQLTRTGVMAPFQRGLERIVKGRTTPIIPVHLDRLSNSIFSPASHRRLPKQIPYPVTISFGKPLPADASLLRDAAGDSRARPGGVGLPQGGPPAACTMGSSTRRGGTRCGWRSPIFRRPTSRTSRPWPARSRSPGPARACWEGQDNVGVLLPASVGGALVNLAAALAGKAVVNLNFTTGRAGMESAAAQAGLKTVVTSRAFLEKAKLEPPCGSS